MRRCSRCKQDGSCSCLLSSQVLLRFCLVLLGSMAAAGFPKSFSELYAAAGVDVSPEHLSLIEAFFTKLEVASPSDLEAVCDGDLPKDHTDWPAGLKVKGLIRKALLLVNGPAEPSGSDTASPAKRPAVQISDASPAAKRGR